MKHSTLETPDIALALGQYRMSDEAIHERLDKLAGYSKGATLSPQELRDALDKELGDKSLSGELRKLRDEE
ncbi:MAG TPA: hypothetical protein PLQ35_10275 [bacterium]|mgnify:FL=1|nr:hypothetical protein [bacterium]HQL62669.1 hypothetical protein [bacterium]